MLTASAADGQQAASASANSAGQMAMQQKVGYYLVPGLQTQMPGSIISMENLMNYFSTIV